MEHNKYYDGAVQSLGFSRAEGRATVGVMSPGEYRFDTQSLEFVKILSGSLDVLLPRCPWRTVSEGDNYIAPAGCNFAVKASAEVAYICEYIEARNQNEPAARGGTSSGTES